MKIDKTNAYITKGPTVTACNRILPTESSPCKYYIKGVAHGEAGFCKLKDRYRCIEAMKHYSPSFSVSAMNTYLQCPYKYYLQYIEGVKIKEEAKPLPMKLGTIWDEYVGMKSAQTPIDMEKIFDMFDTLQVYPSDRARVMALIKASEDLEINFPSGNPQEKIEFHVGETVIRGFVDIAEFDHIFEVKLSKSPDFLWQLHNIHFQVGTYLYSNEAWKHCDMLIARLPQARTGKGQYSDETDVDFAERMYADIVKRPSYYFIGWNNKSRRYGKRFHRGEFNFGEILETYRNEIATLRYRIDHNLWSKNTFSCNVPTECIFMPVRKTGLVSEAIYERR